MPRGSFRRPAVEFHPFSETFPLMEGEAFAALVVTKNLIYAIRERRIWRYLTMEKD
jgi:hypothetical protein